MFNFITKGRFNTMVQAEFQSQCSREDLVSDVCCRPNAMKIISVARRKAYFRHDQIAPFMVVCALLGEAINDPDLSEEKQLYCASFLHKRLEKVASNPTFRVQHLLIFGRLERKMLDWSNRHRELVERASERLGLI